MVSPRVGRKGNGDWLTGRQDGPMAADLRMIDGTAAATWHPPTPSRGRPCPARLLACIPRRHCDAATGLDTMDVHDCKQIDHVFGKRPIRPCDMTRAGGGGGGGGVRA